MILAQCANKLLIAANSKPTPSSNPHLIIANGKPILSTFLLLK